MPAEKCSLSCLLCDLHQLFAVSAGHRRSFFSFLSVFLFLSLSSHTHNLSSSDPLCTAADVIYPQLGCGVFGQNED